MSDFMTLTGLDYWITGYVDKWVGRHRQATSCRRWQLFALRIRTMTVPVRHWAARNGHDVGPGAEDEPDSRSVSGHLCYLKSRVRAFGRGVKIGVKHGRGKSELGGGEMVCKSERCEDNRENHPQKSNLTLLTAGQMGNPE